MLSTTSSRNFLVFSSSWESDRRSVTSSNSAIRNSGSFLSLRAMTRTLDRTRFSEPRSTSNSVRNWPSGELTRRLVGRLDAGRRFRAEDLVGTLADDGVAGEAREAFEGAVGEDVAAVLDALGGHADRHVVEHRFQELLGRRQLPRKLALLAAILMGRHRTAVRQREVLDQNRAPVGQFGNQAFRPVGELCRIPRRRRRARRACAAAPAVRGPVMFRAMSERVRP